MKKKIFKLSSTFLLALSGVAISMSSGIYRFAITPYIHDYFNTSPTKVVKNDASDEQDTQYFKADYKNTTELQEAKFEYIEDSVSEGTVLLKNNNKALPYPSKVNEKKTKVTLLGQASANMVYGMDAGAGMIASADSMCKHFDEALKDAGYEVNDKVYNWYKSTGIHQNNPAGYYGLTGDLIIGEANIDNMSSEAKSSIDDYKDLGILVLSRNCGEGFDLWSGEKDQVIYDEGSNKKGTSGTEIKGVSSLELTPNEKKTIEFAKNAGFKKLVLILNSNHQIALQGLQDDEKIDAILQVGGLGYNGIDGLVNVISGVKNPSGHLITAWPNDSLSAPATSDMGNVAFANSNEVEAYFAANEAGYKGDGSDAFKQIYYTAQRESIYVGYRYYETRYEDSVLGLGNADSEAGSSYTGGWDYNKEMAYTFGYGLSYTTFSEKIISTPKFNSDTKTYNMQVKVTNTGDTAGKHVVQVYASTPYTQDDIDHKVEKSAIQLVNFDKTNLLNPGDSETLNIELDLHDIASWDSLSNDGKGGYILSKGTHYFALGNGAHDALNNVLAAKKADGINVNVNKMDYEGDASKVFSFNQNERDEKTYSISQYTGAVIENQLQDADINYWVDDDKKVTYLTRNDWNTFPEPVEGETMGRTSNKITCNDKMLKEMIGQTSINGKDYSYGSLEKESKDIKYEVDTDYQVSMLMGEDYDSDKWDDILDQMNLDDMTAMVAAGNGFTKSSDSITYPGSKDGDGPIGWYSATLEYKGDKWYNGTTGVTSWKGDVTQGVLPSRIYEGTLVCAASFNRNLETRRGVLLGNEGIFLGRTGIWGLTAANLARTAYSGRNGEYYGEEPIIANMMGVALSGGYQSKGGIAFTKHFAFNDQETNRYGECTFMTEQEARELSLRAFEGILAVEEGKTTSLGLMESFSRIGCTWVGQSYPLMTQILRNEWGFKGPAITDMAVAMLTYYHAPEAVKAGTDYFDTTDVKLYGTDFINREQVLKDPVLHAAVRQAAHRIMYVYVNSLTMNGTPKNASIVRDYAWWEKTIVGIDIGLSALTIVSIALYITAIIKDKKKGELK